MDLHFNDEDKDVNKKLMNRFIDTLALLSNLRRLELLSVTHRSFVTAGLKREHAKFPSIREMVVSPKYPGFVKCSPNLESLTFRHGFRTRSKVAIELCGAKLKRVVGVDFSTDSHVECEFMKASPNLKQLLN